MEHNVTCQVYKRVHYGLCTALMALQSFSSLAKEVMFLVVLVCLFVCGHYSKSYERIGVKFYGRVLGSTVKN